MKIQYYLKLLAIIFLAFSEFLLGTNTLITKPNNLVAQQCDNIIIRPQNDDLLYGKGKEWNTCSGYKFVFQEDGNLVLYSPSNLALWATGTYNTTANILAIQKDGNVVLYDGKKPVWASDTCCRSGAFLAIQEDGNIVVYENNGNPIFATNTYGGKVSTLSAAKEWQNRE